MVPLYKEINQESLAMTVDLRKVTLSLTLEVIFNSQGKVISIYIWGYYVFTFLRHVYIYSLLYGISTNVYHSDERNLHP